MLIIPTATKVGLIIQDVLMKQVAIKVGVVSAIARWQRGSAAWFGGHSLRMSAKTKKQTMRYCAMTCVLIHMLFWTEAYELNKEI